MPRKNRDQGFSRRRGGHSALADYRCGGDVFAIDRLVSVVVGVQRCTTQGCAGEQAFGPRVGKNVYIGVVGALSLSAGGSGNSTGAGAQLQLAGEDLPGAGFGFDEQNVVGGRAAELDA